MFDQEVFRLCMEASTYIYLRRLDRMLLGDDVNR